MQDDIEIRLIGNRCIAIKGIGRLFFESGFPISMSIAELAKQGVEVSILHVADECLKNGWKPKTVIAKLVADFADVHETLDKEQLERFCYAEYEEQRQMIFDYLYADKEQALNYMRDNLKELLDDSNTLKQ